MNAETKEVIDVQFDADQTQVDLDVEEALNEAFSSLGEDKDKVEVTIKVYRASEGGSRRRWLFDLSEGEFNDVTKVLRDRYGSGTYEVRIMVGGRIYRRIMTDVEAPSDVDKLSAKVAAQESPQTKDVLAMFQTMFAQQQEAQRQQTELIMERMRSQNAPAGTVDATQMLSSIVSAMAAMQQLNPQPAQSDPMGMFEKMMDMQIKMQSITGGDSSPALSWAALARDFLPALADITKQKQQLQMQAPRVRRHPVMARDQFKPPQIDLELENPNPSQRQQAGSKRSQHLPDERVEGEKQQTKEEVDEMNLKNQMVEVAFKQALGFLVNKAARGGLPDVYAEVTMDTVEEWRMLDELVSILEDDNWYQGLVHRVPEIAQFKDWFTQLREVILQSCGSIADEEGLTSGNDEAIKEISTGFPQEINRLSTIDAAKDGKKDPSKDAAKQSDAVTGRESGNTGNPKDHAPTGTQREKTSTSQDDRA